MKCLDFDWQINEFMVYCRSTQLREKSMASYEQALRLFERWCAEELRIFTVDKLPFQHHLLYNCSAALRTCKPPTMERYPPHPLAKDRDRKFIFR